MPGFSSRGRIVALALLALVMMSEGRAWAKLPVLCVNLGGTGGCFSAIQDAIDAAGKAGAVIDIDAGTYLENLTIPKTRLTLAGNSGNTHIIASPNVAIAAGARVTISDLDIAEGFNNKGGGCIESAARLTLRNVALELCLGSRGGAIHQVGGSLTMIDSIIDGNQASGDGGCLAMEGGKLSLQNVAFSNCFAGGDGGSVWLSKTIATIAKASAADVVTMDTGQAGGAGGGIFAVGGKLAIDGVAMRSNIALNGDGGAIKSNAPLTISNSQFESNSTQGDGGAIFAMPPGTLAVTRSGFTLNTTETDGGAIAAETTFTLRNLTLAANEADQNGGGILALANGNISSVTIDGNTAFGTGGGITIVSGTVKITNTIIGANAASGGGPDCAGSFSSRGFNLVSDSAGCSISGQTSTNLIGEDPLLDVPGHFDGLTVEEPLLQSPVLGAGGNCPKVDEVLHLRPHTRCDIGAYESP